MIIITAFLLDLIILTNTQYVDLIGNKLSYTFQNLTTFSDVDYWEDYTIHNKAMSASLASNNDNESETKSKSYVELINARHSKDVIFTHGSQEQYNNDHIEIYSPSLESINSALQNITVTTDISNCTSMPCETNWELSAKYYYMANKTSSTPLDTKPMKVGFAIGVIPILKSVFPINAPINNTDSSFVVLKGRGFGSWKRIFKCIFDDNNQLATTAKRIEKDKIRCPIPCFFQIKITSIFIKDEYSGMYSNPLQFTFTEALHLKQIIPSFGTEDGSTKVRVQGERFVTSEFLSCIFDDYINVKATYISKKEIECVTPPLVNFNSSNYEAPKYLSVSNNGVHVSNNKIHFTYVKRVTIENIKPKFIFKRSKKGKYRTLKVQGRNMINNSTIQCKWDEFITSATFISQTEVECLIPDYQTLLWIKQQKNSRLSGFDIVDLSISLNDGADWTANTTFEYRDNPSFIALEPKIAIIRRSTLITIWIIETYRINKNDMILCKFAQPKNSFVEVVPGRFESYTSFSCLTPSSTTQGKVNIEIALNGEEFVDSKLFVLFYSPPTLNAIYPETGPKEGSTKITLFGEGFFNLGRIMCTFGDNGQTSIAYATSDNTISCVTPRVSACGNNYLKLTDGLTEYTINMQGNDMEIGRFYFFSNMTDIEISPRRGATSNQTLVTAFVKKNESDYCPLPSKTSYLCHFGRFLTSVATRTDSHKLSCFAPTIPYVTGKHPYNVDFRISENGRIISTSAIFTYV